MSFSAGYRIERRAEGGGFVQIADVAALSSQPTQSYSDSGLLFDTAYEYRVIAYNSVAISAYSNNAMGVTGLPDIVVTLTTDDAGGADASVHADNPTGTFGTQNDLTVAGTYPTAQSASPRLTCVLISTGCQAPFRTSRRPTLNCHLSLSDFLPRRVWFSIRGYLLTDDGADVWDESSISWNNAPSNNTPNAALLAPNMQVANYSKNSVGADPRSRSAGQHTALCLCVHSCQHRCQQTHHSGIRRRTSAGRKWTGRRASMPRYPPPTLEITTDSYSTPSVPASSPSHLDPAVRSVFHGPMARLTNPASRSNAGLPTARGSC